MIDKDEAIRLLRKEVANKGADFVYQYPEKDSEQCYYFYDGQPSCIVGYALATADEANIARVGKLEGIVQEVARVFPDLMDRQACEIFFTAQFAQDSGNTWGEALSKAELVYRALGGTE